MLAENEKPFRPPHVMPRTTKARFPTCHVAFDTEAWPVAPAGETDTVYWKFRLGSAVYWRFERGQVKREEWFHFTDPAEWWKWLAFKVQKRASTWIWAHNLHFDFRLAGGWEWLQGQAPHDWRLCRQDRPTFFRGKFDGCPVLFVDSLNYFPMTLERLGHSIGLCKGAMPLYTRPEGEWLSYCRRDVEVLQRAVCGLIRFLRYGSKGTLGKTAAATAFNVYRKRFYHVPVYIHGDASACALERRAYFGGQLTCPFIGRVRARLFHLDVNGLYPRVMSTGFFPTKLVETYDELEVAQLAHAVNDWGFVADVLVDSHRSFLVRDDDKRPIEVVGTFRCVLCGQELRDALAAGSILHVYAANCYRTADLFTRFIRFFWRRRENARLAGEAEKDLFYKLLLTSLSGKWAQWSQRWEEDSFRCGKRMWGEVTYRDCVAKVNRHLQWVAGVCQERVTRGETRNSFPAISAFITSAGRAYMHRLRTLAGQGHVYYQDTDSLFVDEVGMDRLCLAGYVHSRRLGCLKIVEEADDVEIFAPKDYRFGEHVVRKGFRVHERAGPDGLIAQWQSLKAADAYRTGPLAEAVQRLVKKQLHRNYKKGTVGPDGWTSPHERHEAF